MVWVGGWGRGVWVLNFGLGAFEGLGEAVGHESILRPSSAPKRITTPQSSRPRPYALNPKPHPLNPKPLPPTPNAGDTLHLEEILNRETHAYSCISSTRIPLDFQPLRRETIIPNPSTIQSETFISTTSTNPQRRGQAQPGRSSELGAKRILLYLINPNPKPSTPQERDFSSSSSSLLALQVLRGP